ncbi:hypothetical protein HAX54_006166 [Datura stramonium]|uniref:Carbamoyl-phosphate synthase small subunit N-terminal domain-containing protein n=1 Tax=Datura stramonium TaxID=4076 RepID=A0ABS8T9U7_DATST|nr:hypothetical protein [Datura stramonium]
MFLLARVPVSTLISCIMGLRHLRIKSDPMFASLYSMCILLRSFGSSSIYIRLSSSRNNMSVVIYFKVSSTRDVPPPGFPRRLDVPLAGFLRRNCLTQISSPHSVSTVSSKVREKEELFLCQLSYGLCCEDSQCSVHRHNNQRPFFLKALQITEFSLLNALQRTYHQMVHLLVWLKDLGRYQEIITDPSYAGQFVLMTNPHIGNTGVNFDDEESMQCFLAGLVIRSLSISTSNWRCTDILMTIWQKGTSWVYMMLTSAITRRLREEGSLIGVLSTENSKSDEELLEMSRTWDIVGVDLISGVSCKSPYEWVDRTASDWEFNDNGRNKETFNVVAYDFGIAIIYFGA